MKNKTKYPPLFTSDTDWPNNACLNYFDDALEIYTIGYKKGADLLVSKIIESAKDQDSLVYPIVFLYRQYLELRLKEIIREGNRLLEIKEDFPSHHEIHKLWPIVKKILRSVFKEKDPEDFHLIEHIIDEFKNVDPFSFSFRYPTDKSGNNPTKGITHINVRHLAHFIEKASEFLDSVSFAISVYRDSQDEFKNDY